MTLALVGEAPDQPTGDVLLDVDQVREMFPHDPSRWWVRWNVAPDQKITIGRRVFWWQSDVLAWINAHKQGAA